MIRSVCTLLCTAILPVAAALVSETPASKLSHGLLFTDESCFNSNDFCGDPTSFLDEQKAGVTMAPGFRRLTLHDRETGDTGSFVNAVSVPITIADPGRIVFKPHYSFARIETIDGKISNNANRLGFIMLAQSERKGFRFGFDGEVQIGKTVYSDRTILNTDALTRRHFDIPSRLGLYLGSQPAEAVRFTVFGRTRLMIDTLVSENTDLVAENQCELVLPSVGFDVDIGKKGLPWKSDFVWDFSRTNFTVSSPAVVANSLIGDPWRALQGIQLKDADALVCDSIAWQWQNLGKIPVKDILVVKPSSYTSYWHGRYHRYSPQGKNRPFDYGDEQDKWETSAFRLGFGLGLSVRTYVDLGGEYSRSFVRMMKDTTPYVGQTGALDEKKTGYSHLGLSAKTGLHNYITPLSKAIELSLGVSFLRNVENGLDPSLYRDDFVALLPGASMTEAARYSPWNNGFKTEVTTNRFALELQTSFLEKQLGFDFSWAFIGRETSVDNTAAKEEKGFEFGVDMIFNKFKF